MVGRDVQGGIHRALVEQVPVRGLAAQAAGQADLHAGHTGEALEERTEAEEVDRRVACEQHADTG
jgi:hypothetical protein